MSVSSWIRQSGATVVLAVSGCGSSYTVPSEVAYFCPHSQRVRVPEAGGERMGWPDGMFSKSAPSDPTRLPECKEGDSSERCKVRLRAGYWDLPIHWGEAPVSAFRGTVYRVIISSDHYGPKIVRVNHADGKTLLTARALERYPAQDGTYWTWTRLRELTPAEWANVQRLLDQADIWNTPEVVPEGDKPRRTYGGGGSSLEVYDGTRHRTITRRRTQSPEFWRIVDLIVQYAKCPPVEQ